jgi:hypothetical protein
VYICGCVTDRCFLIFCYAIIHYYLLYYFLNTVVSTHHSLYKDWIESRAGCILSGTCRMNVLSTYMPYLYTKSNLYIYSYVSIFCTFNCNKDKQIREKNEVKRCLVHRYTRNTFSISRQETAEIVFSFIKNNLRRNSDRRKTLVRNIKDISTNCLIESNM